MTDREADEICRQVVELTRRVKAKLRQEPNTVHCPAYDDLVTEGRLPG